ncbi:MAG: response regulator [Gemmatimonadales bacterium]
MSPRTSAGSGSWPPRPVLIVDTDVAIRESVCRMVRGLGYRVRTARSGADAVRAVRQGGTELGVVLARARMSPMDGGEVAERIRDAHADVRVALLAGPGPDDDELLAAYPELPVLRQPVRLGELYALLAALLGPPVVARGRPEGPARWLRRPRDRSERPD